MFETCCNLGATKIALSCRDKNRLCKRAFKDTWTNIVQLVILLLLFMSLSPNRSFYSNMLLLLFFVSCFSNILHIVNYIDCN